jgi:galactose-1-phosphate uridylyltransferase
MHTKKKEKTSRENYRGIKLCPVHQNFRQTYLKINLTITVKYFSMKSNVVSWIMCLHFNKSQKEEENFAFQCLFYSHIMRRSNQGRPMAHYQRRKYTNTFHKNNTMSV